MMKSQCLLCFLGIIAVSSIARGEDEDSTPSYGLTAQTPLPGGGNETSTNLPSSSSSSSSMNHTSAHPVDKASPVSTSRDAKLTTENCTNEEEGGGDSQVTATETANGSVAPQTTAIVRPSTRGRGVIMDISTVSMAMTTTLLKPVVTKERASSWGYILLVLIILAIIALCVILFFLRKGARTYSFDLHRQGQLIHTSGIEHNGTFEPVNLDDLDRPAPIDHVNSADLSSSPVANGTSLQSEEKESTGENAPNGQVDGGGLETPPINFDNFSLDIDLTDKKSDQLDSPDSFFDTTGEEQQNGNNNNPSVFPSEPFVEINLDEPAWIDHLLTSSAPPSSVLPFSPFSLSSSPPQLH